MRIDVITLFPKMFDSPFGESMIARAQKKGNLDLRIHDMRKWAWNSYGAVDDRPYGGGVGMLIRVDVIYKALEEIKIENKGKVILTSARGIKYNQKKAEELSIEKDLIIICGHYEGFDERVSQLLVDEEISVGDYVLTGGELAAMIIIDSSVRLIPGVLGKDQSSTVESFSEAMIEGEKVRVAEYPQYTRPAEFMGSFVPEVLMSGDPKHIKKWQEEEIIKGLKNGATNQNNGKKGD